MSFESDTRTTPFLVVSFYTGKYAGEAASLAESLDSFGIDYQIDPVPEGESWQANCRHRVPFLIDKLSRNRGRPIVWLDADAVVRQEPELFSRLDADFAVCIRGPELLAGTMFFANNLKSRQFLTEIEYEHKRDPQRFVQSQDYIRLVWDRWKDRSDWRFESLPFEYVKIFDTGHDRPAVIEHFQASRRFYY